MIHDAGVTENNGAKIGRTNGEILVVDDEPFNLEIISELLSDAGYNISTAEDGEIAREMLLEHPARFQAALIDRMMPNMDGLALIKFIRTQPQLCHLPLILQTAKTTVADLETSIKEGIIYFLSKPFNKETLLNITDTAISRARNQRGFSNSETAQPAQLLGQIMEYRTLEQAREIAAKLAAVCPNPQRVVTGLNELMINSIEHGNLDVGFTRKTQLLQKGKWQEEIELRLHLDKYKDRVAKIWLTENDTAYIFTIKDQGKGFNFAEFLKINPQRAVIANGRGVVIANSFSFDHLQYVGCGNEVIARVNKKSEPA